MQSSRHDDLKNTGIARNTTSAGGIQLDIPVDIHIDAGRNDNPSAARRIYLQVA